MRKVFFGAMVVIFVFFPHILCAQDQPAPDRVDYVVGPGDVLFISVWQDQTLTQSVPVRPDGRISFPLIGEIMAADKTVAQVQKEIEDKISRYVTDPVLTVGVEEIKSILIYVIGRVNSPGRFELNGNINVLQALAMAGGCNTFADTRNIKVFRQVGNKTSTMNFNYNDVSSGKNLDQNIMLERGDVIVVP